MKTADNIFYLMQLAGGTFPSGGFSQSWGLETYVSEGKICDSSTFSNFLEVYLEYHGGQLRRASDMRGIPTGGSRRHRCS